MACADHYGWTPPQVAALDPDYAAELRVVWAAQADHEADELRKLRER